MKNLSINKIIWIVTALLSLGVSFVGILYPGIYVKVINRDLTAGAYSQDLMTMVVSILLLFFTIFIKKDYYKLHSIIIGILGYLFYAYGIYVIERMYNNYYLFYIAIFTLSFWGIIYAISNIRHDILHALHISNRGRIISFTGSLLQPIIFYPLWIIQLLPLMATGKRIESLYSIFILDLCFIMPAFLILALFTFKKKSLGLYLSPSMFVLGFTLIFSLTMGELVKPHFNALPNIAALEQSLILSILLLLLAIIHLRSIYLQKKI